MPFLRTILSLCIRISDATISVTPTPLRIYYFCLIELRSIQQCQERENIRKKKKDKRIRYEDDNSTPAIAVRCN
jgi:hypothetical protein